MNPVRGIKARGLLKRCAAASLMVALAGSATAVSVSPAAITLTQGGATATLTLSSLSGTVVVTASDPVTIATAARSGTSAVTVKSIGAGYTIVTIQDAVSKVQVPVTVVTPAQASTNRYVVLAWNDLGMHCMDGKDYSVFSILPPYNNLNAQLVDRASWSGPVAPSSFTGYTTLSGSYTTYESMVDSVTKSINTFSGSTGDVSKTNFWLYAKQLYGVQPNANCGLTGYRTPGTTASRMAFNSKWKWFEGPGLPITPLSEATPGSYSFVRNEYPMVKVTAKSSSGTVLASTATVLPVSDEITCKSCHASTSKPSWSTRTGNFAQPANGWVQDADAERDWKFNILRRHDDLHASKTPYRLETSARNGTPVLCASCHGSNALNLTPNPTSTPWLTSALHTNHAYVTDPAVTVDPAQPVTLGDSTNRSACYSCHPGSSTQCLRGAMSTVSAVQCQSCHGGMTKVGDPARVGWLQQPTCQACHNGGKRYTSAVDANGNPLTTADLRFATNANTPGTGYSLFRYSVGHGKMQCESCHGATHAEYPSTHANDNVQSITLQGYKGTVMECLACHKSAPEDSRLASGPHGMHWTGPTWVSKHNNFGQSNPGSCTACHGADYRGSALAQVKSPRSFKSKKPGGVMSYAAGMNVGCYDCHNGPSGQQ